MKRFLSHVATLWGRRWPLPLIPLFYALVIASYAELRPEHVVFAVVAAALGYASAKSKQFLIDVSPYLAVAIGYDLVRYIRPLVVTADRVLGCGLRQAELTLFAVGPGQTPQDYFAVHHHWAFDLLFAVPYTIFAYVALIYAAYLFFVDRRRMRLYLWAFAIANFMSFATWLVLPAAPPWYLRMHGCVIDTSVLPSPAGLSRVDALLGIHYYQTFYSRASSVFGALPSMHCAYPLIGLLTAWRAASFRTRPIHIVYTLVMASAAVYLDHHWVIDVLAGFVMAVVAVWLSKRAVRRVYGPLVIAPGSLVSATSAPLPVDDG